MCRGQTSVKTATTIAVVAKITVAIRALRRQLRVSIHHATSSAMAG